MKAMTYYKDLLSQLEIHNCISYARNKLDQIINREGDENGIRRTPEYFEMLIEEEICSAAFRKSCEQAMKNGGIKACLKYVI